MALTLSSGSDNSVTTTANTTHYFPFSGSIGQAFSTTEADVAVILRDTGTFKNLSILVTANSISGGASTIRTRKNAGNGNLSVSVGASATGDFSDTGNTDSIADSDTYNMQFVPGAATGTMNIVCVSVAFDATSSSDSVCKLIAAQSTNYTTASSTRYSVLNGVLPQNGQTTESIAQAEIRKSASLRNLTCRISTNSRTTTTTVSVRVNGSTSTLSMSIGSSATGTFQDTDSVSVVAGDDVNYSIATGTGTQTLTMKHIAVTHYTGSSAGIGMVMCGNTSVRTTNANVTVYMGMGGSLQATSSSGEDSIDTNVLHNFTASDLSTRVTANTVTAATTIRLRKNASNTALVASVTASTSGIFTDSSNTENIVSGDNLATQVAAGATGTSINYSATWWYSTISGTSYTRSPTADDVTIADSSITRLLSAVRLPSTDTTTVTDSSLTRQTQAFRSPSSDTITVADSSITKSETRVRATSADTITIADSSLTRMLSAVRVPSTEVPAVSENLTRMISAIRVPTSDSITATDSSTTRSATRVRAPTTDTVTPSDSSLTRILSATRLPSTDTITVTAGTATRMLSATRVPASDTITTNDNATKQQSYLRVPSTDSITVSDSSLTRLLSLARVPSTDSTTVLDSSLTRILSLLRIPTADTITVSENVTGQYTQGAAVIERAPSAENITVADASLTRLLSALRLPSTDAVTTGEVLTRILSAIRSPTLDSVVTSDNATRSKTFVLAPSADSITVSDSSVTRMLSATRVPSADTITVTAGTATRMLSALRLPSTEVISVGESVGSTVSGRVSRSVSDTVDIIESSLTRMLSAIRMPSQDTTNVNEQLTRSRTAVRLIAADTTVVSEAALTRIVSLTRSVTSDTTAIIESALNRILSAARNLQDTVTVAELQSLIQHSRVVQDTISITEPSLKRVVTAIRAVAPEFVDVTESVFFQTFHKFVFDSVTVAEQLFRERQQLFGSVTYAIPSEVRPLLGNIGPTQRTDDQINLAIDAAYDEINTKTNRIPPNDWKDTDHNFGIVKKLTRYIAARECAIGIKDFDTKPLDMEIEHLFNDLLTFDTSSDATQDIVGSSPDMTYALNDAGLIWSVRYKNLRKGSSGENNTTINPDA